MDLGYTGDPSHCKCMRKSLLDKRMKQRITIGIIIVLAILVIILFSSIDQKSSPPGEVENNATLIVPGKSLIGIEETYLSPNSGIIEAGQNLTFELRIEKNKEAIRDETIALSLVKGNYSDDELPLPNGMTLACNPSMFTSYPGNVYKVSIIMTTTKEVPVNTYFIRIQRNFDSGREVIWTSVQVTAPTKST